MPKLKQPAVYYCGSDERADPKTAELVLQGWELQQQIDELQGKLDANKMQLKALHGKDGVRLKFEGGTFSVLFKVSHKINDIAKLKNALGARFVDLVETKTTYSPTEKLKSAAVDEGNPLHIKVCTAMTRETLLSVGWRATKK